RNAHLVRAALAVARRVALAVVQADADDRLLVVLGLLMQNDRDSTGPALAFRAQRGRDRATASGYRGRILVAVGFRSCTGSLLDVAERLDSHLLHGPVGETSAVEPAPDEFVPLEPRVVFQLRLVVLDAQDAVAVAAIQEPSEFQVARR